MRDIKFRVWDKIDKEMRKVREIGFDQCGGVMYVILTIPFLINNGDVDFDFVKRKPGEFILLRYTGLKDKNGKEIYEGDIINQKYKLGNRYYLVKYDNTIASFVMKKLNRNNFESNKVGTETRFYTHDCKKSEVVGNKYENPELLEE